MLFLVAAVVIGVIAKLGEEGTVNTIVAGASDFLGAGLVIVAGPRHHRGDEEHLHHRHRPATGWRTACRGHVERRASPCSRFLVNIPIAFLVPSSSGHAALVMPILAPLADFAGVDRSIDGHRLTSRRRAS